MKAKYKTIIACMVYLALIFIFSFFLSSIKNHYFVIGKKYIGAEYVTFMDYASKGLITFCKEYYRTLLLFLIPLIFINGVFIDTIIHMTGKSVFNCVSFMVLISSIFEGAAFYINRGTNLLQIAMFAVFMLFVVAMEFAFRIYSKSRLSFIYPFFVGILINMYYGIFILSTSYSIYNFVPLLVLICGLYIIRALSSFLDGSRTTNRILSFARIILIIALFLVILGFAGYDYLTNDPHHKVWQQLYYVAVYSSFFGIYIMPYLAKVLYGAGGTIGDVESKRKLTLIINAVLLTLIPILCIFAVHGVILIILNGIILQINFFFVLLKPVALEEKKSNIHYIAAIAFMISTFIYIAVDPIIYLNASKYISMIWPLLCILFVGWIGSTLLSWFKPQNERMVQYVPRIIKVIKDNFDIRIQAILCVINLAILGGFGIIYKTKEYAEQSRNNLDVGYIDQRLEGFGGLYLSSWCMIPIFVNVLVSFISIIWTIIKAQMMNSGGEKC